MRTMAEEPPSFAAGQRLAMTLQLIVVSRPEEWAAYHRIRRTVLFEARGRYGVYDAEHPDDRDENNCPMLLMRDGQALGTVRFDLLGGDRAGVRLVAIDIGHQRRGHGRTMMALVEKHAAERGVSVLELNSAPEAVAFYERLGWAMIDADREHPLMERRL